MLLQFSLAGFQDSLCLKRLSFCLTLEQKHLVSWGFLNSVLSVCLKGGSLRRAIPMEILTPGSYRHVVVIFGGILL